MSDMSRENGQNGLKNAARPVVDFINALEKEVGIERAEERKRAGGGEEADIGEAGESMALLYEKVRNLIEYKDDHLIKRNAIERILRRNLIIEFRGHDFSDQFLTELAMAGYIHRQEINQQLKEKVRKIIGKYQKLVKGTSGLDLKKFVVAMASCEVEEAVFPNPAKKALVRAMYQSVHDRIVFQGRDALSEGEKKIQIYLAVLKSLTKLDNTTLSYSLFKIYFPGWFEENIKEGDVGSMISELASKKDYLEEKVENPLSSRVTFALKKYAVYFNVFHVVVINNFSRIKKLLSDPESLKFAVQVACGGVYDKEMSKFKKRVRRSLIFLIITKVLLAVLVEYPYDRYIAGQVNETPLIINLLFPPLLLMLLSATVHRPGEENSALIAKGVEEIVYRESERPIIVVKMDETKTFSEKILNLFFLLTFIISFGMVIWILNVLSFNLLGILIFLFLFSVVSFFSALVRQPVRDLIITKGREGTIGMVVDTLSIPFVRMGKWMSVKFSRVNVFVFIFDVIIEAPFKIVVRFIQEWAGFIRRKKEEMI